MRSLLAIACAAALLAACARKAAPATARAARPSQIQTIDSSAPKLAPLQPPPVLTDEAPPPKSTISVVQPADAPPPPTPQDEAVRAALPFAPAIALDPVDGSKISIRATTPTFEIKGHVFYFTSEENKKTFAANPQQFLKGAFNIKL